MSVVRGMMEAVSEDEGADLPAKQVSAVVGNSPEAHCGPYCNVSCQRRCPQQSKWVPAVVEDVAAVVVSSPASKAGAQ